MPHPVATILGGMSHLLIIDDEQSICWGLTKLAQRMGHTSEAVGSAELGLKAAERHKPDAIVLDVRLPGMTGLVAIEKFQALSPDVPVVIITAYGDLETAVEAVRHGAFEYLVKPFDLQLAERTIIRALTASGVVGAGRWRHDLSRRSGRNSVGVAGEVAARVGARRDLAGRRQSTASRRLPTHFGDASRSEAACGGWFLPSRPVFPAGHV
jgi:DNA-binding NtrC family response regulator